ncbi:hypothetical protein QUF80_07455 [Desulfococcaceae bacterium HSG8]|nr:hypothetical protein [Desulfococcaceae bacterium HSG8]
MENYKIEVGINIVKCDGSESADPKMHDDIFKWLSEKITVSQTGVWGAMDE